MSAALLPMLKAEDVQTASDAFNLLGDEKAAFGEYFQILKENRFDVDFQNDVVEIFKFHADEVKEEALSLYKQGIATEYMLEILSRVKEGNEEIYQLLLTAFLSGENVPMKASYLASYGDERALPHLYKRIEDESIGFVEFQELKYAIEALGGEYNEPRGFTADKDYLAIEAAGAKGFEPDSNKS